MAAKTGYEMKMSSNPPSPKPLNTFYYGAGDVHDIAVAYAYHLAENQPFVDGNKRTAITTALMFLEANGVVTTLLANEQLYDAMIGIAEKRLDKVGLAKVFRSQLG